VQVVTDQPLDRRIADVAGSQGGPVTAEQLNALGMSRTGLHRRTSAGSLIRIHDTVYAVGHTALAPLALIRAAVMACGLGAVASHLAAAYLWGLLRWEAGLVDVTSVRSLGRTDPAIRLHRARRLVAMDVDERHGVGVTSVARTLVDIAGSRPRLLHRAIAEAQLADLYDADAIAELLERSRGRRGAQTLRRALPSAARTRSSLERLGLRLLREYGLPAPPHVNVLLHGYEVDFYWPEANLVVEIDGTAVHSTLTAQHRDPVKDAALRLAGIEVVRLAEQQLRQAPAAAMHTVRLFMRRAGLAV
jgi:very-short-patch-repair endonuclease